VTDDGRHRAWTTRRTSCHPRATDTRPRWRPPTGRAPARALTACALGPVRGTSGDRVPRPHRASRPSRSS
jgi:hypothetical protein